MGFRIRRSIRLGPWLRLNRSGGEASLTAGIPGANVNLSRRGVKATVGLPGAGISYSTWVGRGAGDSVGAAVVTRPSDSPWPAVTHVSPEFDQRSTGCYEDLVAGLETVDPWIPLPDEFNWRLTVPPRLTTPSDLRGVAAGTERLSDPRFGLLGISQSNAARLIDVLRGDEAAIHDAVRTAIAGLQVPFDLAVSFGVKGGVLRADPRHDPVLICRSGITLYFARETGTGQGVFGRFPVLLTANPLPLFVIERHPPFRTR